MIIERINSIEAATGGNDNDAKYRFFIVFDCAIATDDAEEDMPSFRNLF